MKLAILSTVTGSSPRHEKQVTLWSYSKEKTDGEEDLNPLDEPYVVAADVYSVSPHASRDGLTWYRGATKWMYRLIVELVVRKIVSVQAILHLLPSLQVQPVYP